MVRLMGNRDSTDLWRFGESSFDGKDQYTEGIITGRAGGVIGRAWEERVVTA